MLFYQRIAIHSNTRRSNNKLIIDRIEWRRWSNAQVLLLYESNVWWFRNPIRVECKRMLSAELGASGSQNAAAIASACLRSNEIQFTENTSVEVCLKAACCWWFAVLFKWRAAMMTYHRRQRICEPTMNMCTWAQTHAVGCWSSREETIGIAEWRPIGSIGAHVHTHILYKYIYYSPHTAVSRWRKTTDLCITFTTFFSIVFFANSNFWCSFSAYYSI